MTDEIQSNIRVNIDTASALANLKKLQTQISEFQTQMAKADAKSAMVAGKLQAELVKSINATGKFAASFTTVKSTAEAFTQSLEKNKLSLGEYFRYAGASSKSFGRLFKQEFDTISQVAESRVRTLQTQYVKLGRDANGAMQAIKIRPLALDMENLATRTQVAAQKQQLLNQLLKQGSTNLLNFGKNTQWSGRQLMVGFTIPLAIMGSTAAKAYMQMEQAAVKFKRVYGDISTGNADTEKALKNIQALANEYTKYGVAVADTMDMASQAAAAGKQGADLVAQVNQANKLAVLGGVDQQKSLETTISLTNAFNISAKNLSGTIDFLNSVENQTVLSIDDLTTAIPKAAPVVQQLGGDVKDLAFFMTAMKEGGINASEGANAIKSGLSSLINPTAKASAFLKGFGVDVKGIVEADKGNLKKTVVDFANALNTLDPLNRARAIEQMFGKFQFARMSTLFKNVTDAGSQAAKVLDLASLTSGQLAYMSEKELKRIESSPLFKFQKAIADFQTQLAPVGEQFMKAVTPIINFGTDVLKAFNNLDNGVKQFIVTATGIGLGLGPVLIMTFGLIANGVAQIIKGFALFKSFVNGASRSTDELGAKTQYMTTEQLNAAAAAASLDQAHSKLRQTFTSEKIAVEQLTAAYERSVAAQAAFMGTGGGRKRTPKFASGGIFRGPGTGTSDSIVARVSNGEAIIPAASVARHPDIVNSLISGNIPGFSKGIKKAAIRAGRLSEAPSIISKQTKGMSWSTKDSERQALLNALMPMVESGEITQAQLNDVIHIHASHVNPDFSENSTLGRIKNWKADNLLADYGVINKYSQALSNRKDFAPDAKSIAKSLGISTKQAQAEVAKIMSGIHPATQISADVLHAIASRDTGYHARGVEAVLSARKAGEFYDPSAMGARAYDSSRDQDVAADLARRTDKAEGVIRRGTQSPAGTAPKPSRTVRTRPVIANPSETQAMREDLGNGVTRHVSANGRTTYRKGGVRISANAAELIASSTPGETKKGFGSKLGGKLGGLGLAASVLGPMVGGDVGNAVGMAGNTVFAFQTLKTVFPKLASGFAQLLPKLLPLTPLFAGATLAIGGFALAANIAIEAEKKKAREINALGDAATLTSKKMKALGSFFGIADSTSPLERAKISTEGIKSGKDAKSVQALMGSKEYKTNFSQTYSALRGASESQIANTLTSITVGLRGKGYSDEQIDTVVSALKQSSGNASNTFDPTKLSNKMISSRIGSQISGYGKTFGGNTGVGATRAGAVDPLNVQTFSKNKATALATVGGNLGTMLAGFSGQFDKGTLDAKEFNLQFDNLDKQISKIGNNDGVLILNQALKSMPEDVQKMVSGLSDANDKLLLIRAASVGVQVTAEEIAGLSGGSASGADRVERMGGARAKDSIETKIKKMMTLIKDSLTGTATDSVDPLQTKMDNLGKALGAFAPLEDKINKKYDARLKALDAIQKVNEQITRQQQSQLDLAGALAGGDAAAAAKIAQEMRANDAQSAIDEQRSSLDQAKQNELDNLKIKIGGKYYTRKQLTKLQDAAQAKQTASDLASIGGFAMGGIVPKYFATGGFAMGTDTVPAMLTPGEFVVRKSAVDRIGTSTLNKINGYADGGVVGGSGAGLGDSVYNYSINVSVATGANPNEIANAVMRQIKNVDNQRIRGVSY